MTNSALPFISGQRPGEPYNGLIENLLLIMYQAQYSQATITSYGWHLYQMCIWCEQHGINTPADINEKHMLFWGGTLRGKYRPQTQKLAITAAMLFFKWLIDKDMMKENPALILRRPTVRPSPQRTLSMGEVLAILDSCRQDTPKGQRDRTMIAILLDSGLRASELCGLKVKNVYLKDCKLLVHSKGGADQHAFLSVDTRDSLAEWLKLRRNLVHNTDSVFFSIGGIRPGSSLTPRGLRTILGKLGNEVGVPNVHPHAFRRAFASLRIKAGQSTRSVQILGRWADLKTFERYTLSLDADEDYIRRGADRFSPFKTV